MSALRRPPTAAELSLIAAELIALEPEARKLVAPTMSVAGFDRLLADMGLVPGKLPSNPTIHDLAAAAMGNPDWVLTPIDTDEIDELRNANNSLAASLRDARYDAWRARCYAKGAFVLACALFVALVVLIGYAR